MMAPNAMEDPMQQPGRFRRPRRVQLRRTRGWRMPANTVKVDRTTRFGNPFSIEGYGRETAVALHVPGSQANAAARPFQADCCGTWRRGAQR